MPSKCWNTIFRLYGPLQAYYDKEWKPGDFKTIGNEGFRRLYDYVSGNNRYENR